MLLRDNIITSILLFHSIWFAVIFQLALSLLPWWLADFAGFHFLFLEGCRVSFFRRIFLLFMSIFIKFFSLIYYYYSFFALIIPPYFWVFFTLRQSRKFLYASFGLFNLAFHVGAYFRHFPYEQEVHFLLGEITLVHRHLDFLSLT